MKVLAEVIGGAQKVLTIGGNPSIPELAALAAGSADRSLTDEEGQDLNWILYVPNGKGGFAPASRGDVFDDIEAHSEDASGSESFAGPGQAEGEDYAFRIRLFVPSPRPPVRPPDSGPVPISDDEDVIDLTNIDADSGDLVGVRRVRKKRRRKKTGEATDPGRPKRKRPSGKFPTIKAEEAGTVSEIGPAAAAADDEASEDARVDLPNSDAEMTFSEGVAFSDDGGPEDPAIELTIGDGTLGPAAQGAALNAVPSDVQDEDHGDDVQDEDHGEEAVTAVALPAVSRPAPPADPLTSVAQDEEVLIGSTTVDHEDVELSIPQDTIPLGVQAPTDGDEGNTETPSEVYDDDDGPPTQPKITELPDHQAAGAEHGSDLAQEPDDDSDAPTVPDSAPEPEEGAEAVDAHAPAAAAETPAPKKKRRRKRKRKPPPPRKAPIVTAAILLAAACVGLLCLLHSRGVI